MPDNSDSGTLSEAARRRKPLGVPCSSHRDKEATFYCDRCEKSFCEACVGMEAGPRTFCLHCAVAAEGEMDAEQARQRPFKPPREPFRSIPLLMLIGIALAGVAYNAFQIYRDHQQRSTDTVVITTPSPQIEGIAECRHRMQKLAAAAISFRKTFERFPSSIGELKPVLESDKQSLDPVSKQPYVLQATEDGRLIIRCPDPAAHGVFAIEVQPGKVARVDYNEPAGVRP